ncbi:MAG TPA: hypothetical protein VES03_10915 [Motilibacterales bacterium]|nr:hypothetical protein [Motilibacterales bacterium]
MSWTWQYHAAQGAPIPESASQPADGFPTQADAETWVGEVWRDLLEEGIDGVSLYEDDRLVYGPMSLHPSQ